MGKQGALTILAAGAHPDDIELCCSGTLAKYAQAGHKVYVSVTCRGNAGTLDMGADEIVRIRAAEAKRAADIIGAELIMLGVGDAELFFDRETMGIFIKLMRRVRPDVIITHPPEEENWHNDHMLTRRLVMDASIWATHHNLWVESDDPPCDTTPSLFYWEQYMNGFLDHPTHYVDITDTFDIKVKALSQHESQLKFLRRLFGSNFAEMVELNAKLRGYQCGVRYAEAFKELNVYPRVKPYRVLP